MSANWSDPPGAARLMKLAELGVLGDNLSADTGESRRVCRLPRFPGWLFKEYRKPLTPSDADRLKKLIYLPSQMKPADLRLVNGHTAWPATQVVGSGGETLGALMPLAPASFNYQWTLRPGKVIDKPLEVDVLALSETAQRDKNLPAQSLTDRIAVCSSFAAIGGLFERHGLVYLDWSGANVFWSTTKHDAFVIDMDGCSIGPRKQIQTHSWEDPLVPMGAVAGNPSDRYRVALLAARCLTGLRGDPPETVAALQVLRRGCDDALRHVALELIRAIDSPDKDKRPTIASISLALDFARLASSTGAVPTASSGTAAGLGKGGAVGWKPITPRTTASRPAKPATPPPRTPPTASALLFPPGSGPGATTTASAARASSQASPASPGAAARQQTVRQQSTSPAKPKATPAQSGTVSGAIGLVVVALIILGIALLIFT